jgi:nucleoporin POM152
MRSSIPSTPLSGNRGSPAQGTNFGSPRLPDVSKLAPAALKRQDPDGPLISFETIDAPAQRAYVVGLYTALWFWRLYDYYNLTLGEGESLWLFMKWVAIDGVFLYALPGFRIPWLEWSLVTMTVLFCGHAFLDFILMFRVRVSQVDRLHLDEEVLTTCRFLGLHLFLPCLRYSTILASLPSPSTA